MARPKTPEDTHTFKVGVSFRPDDYQKVLEYCQRCDRSLSWVIREALQEFLERHTEDKKF